MTTANAGSRLSFVTPYWSGRESMEIHLQSIRRLYPSAPILISKRGGEREEMERYREVFQVQYWLEDCSLIDAHLRLLTRCDTDYVCVLDHDVVLLSGLDRYVQGMEENHYDLVGVEERIREPPDADWRRVAPECLGWFRLAPGNVALNIILFNVREFLARWGLRGVIGTRSPRTKDYELDYGVSQRLVRHKYLLPFHTRTYGLGNVLMDGDAPVMWHQWYGSHRDRLARLDEDCVATGRQQRSALIARGERAFLEDYPDLDFSELTPAWGPDQDVVADGEAIARARPGRLRRSLRRAGGWWALGGRELAARGWNRFERWRMLQRAR